VAHGNFVSAQDFEQLGSGPILLGTGQRVRLFNDAGALLAIAEVGPDGLLRPSIVLV
jgi:hypothetical protein